MAKWTAEAAPLKGVAVVSAHKGWVYMYHWLGMNEVATLEPKPGIPPSGADLKNVLDTLKRTPARMVIYAAYQDPRPVNWMTEHSGLPAAKLPFSPGGLKGTDDLFGFYDVTIRSEEHTSELQSLMRISYAVFCLKKKIRKTSIQVTIYI